MTIAAAVTTYNRLESLKKVISSIRGQERRPDEIVVVNDVSSDGTRAWLDAQPDLVAVHTEVNGGCAGSFHRALKTAFERGHDFVWAMDDDVYPEPDALRIILEAHDELTAKGIKVGGLTAYQAQWGEDEVQWLPFRLPSSLARAFRYRYMSPEIAIEKGKGEPVEIDLYAFIGTLFPRAAMAEVGFPDPNWYYYGEDTDYAFRLKNAGFKSYIVPRSVVSHLGAGFKAPPLLPPKANWRYYYMYRNQLALARRARPLLGPVKTAACVLRIMMGVSKRLWMESKRGNFGACRMALMGVGDAITGRMGKRVAPG